MARFGAGGAGKSALVITKEFRLNQGLRDGTAVDLDDRLFGAAGIGLLAWLPFRRPLAEPWAGTSDALLLLAASVLITGSVLLFTAGVLAELLVRIQYSTGEHRVYTVVRELRSSERPRRAVA